MAEPAWGKGTVLWESIQDSVEVWLGIYVTFVAVIQGALRVLYPRLGLSICQAGHIFFDWIPNGTGGKDS
jgi:hypothetical protein